MTGESDAAAAAAALAAQTTGNERPAPSTSLSHSIDKLDGTMATGKSNYNAWRFRLVRILKEKDLLTIVSELPPIATPVAGASTAAAAGKAPSNAQELVEFHTKDNQAFTIITLNIRDTQIPHIQRCDTAKEAWDALREVHQGIGANGRMVLTQRLWSLYLREGEDMASHLNAFREISNQIENLSTRDGAPLIQGIDLVSMLSLSLPDSYEPLVMALQSRSEELTFDFFAGRLLQESTRRQAANGTGASPSAGQSAFLAGGRGRFGGWGYSRGSPSQRGLRFAGRGRPAFGAADAGRFGNAGANRGPARKVVGRCHYCDKEGHWKPDCLKRKADEAGGRHRKEQEGGQTAFVALTAKSSPSNDWIVDSGASQHISAQRQQFLNYLPISTIKIQIGDGSEIEAIGKGDMVLTIGKNAIKLQDVLHVPRIGSNLLSVAKVVDHGHHLLFSPSGCHISSDQGTRIQRIREGNVYLLRTDSQALVALNN